MCHSFNRSVFVHLLLLTSLIIVTTDLKYSTNRDCDVIKNHGMSLSVFELSFISNAYDIYRQRHTAVYP
jgi:hypothetical protein